MLTATSTRKMTCLSFGGGQAIEKCQARNNSRHCALLNTEILSVCLSILLVGFFLIHSPNACSHSTRVMASLEKHSESSSTGLSRVSETIKVSLLLLFHKEILKKMALRNLVVLVLSRAQTMWEILFLQRQKDSRGLQKGKEVTWSNEKRNEKQRSKKRNFYKKPKQRAFRTSSKSLEAR